LELILTSPFKGTNNNLKYLHLLKNSVKKKPTPKITLRLIYAGVPDTLKRSFFFQKQRRNGA